MDEFENAAPQERNPLTHERHRREVFWQIAMPLSVGGLAVLLLAFLAGSASAINASQWADISLIWLIAPLFIIALITLALLGVMIFLIIKLIEVLPFQAFRLNSFLILLNGYIQNVGNSVTEPFVRFQSWTASVRSFGGSIRPKSTNRSANK
jgi:hypothetical protein